MRDSERTPLAQHRSRMKRQGFVRVEVQVQKEDATLVRSVANALSNPARQQETRAILRDRFGRSAKGLKALLAAAPLEDIDLDRPRDFGRNGAA